MGMFIFGISPYTSLNTGPTHDTLWLMKVKVYEPKDQYATAHCHVGPPSKVVVGHSGESCNCHMVTFTMGSISLAK